MITIYKPEELNPLWDVNNDTQDENLWDFPLNEVDYLIEHHDYGNFVLYEDMIIFFNNSLAESFYADYYGNIIGNTEFELSDELKEIVKLEGQKSQLTYFGEIKER